MCGMPMSDRHQPIHLLTGHDKITGMNQTACNEMFSPTDAPCLPHTQKVAEVTCRKCLEWLARASKEMDEIINPEPDVVYPITRPEEWREPD